MNYDNDLKEIKIRHILIMYLITVVILIITSIFILSNSGGEISNSNINSLSLLAGILIFIMLIYKIKPSKEKIKLLYEDFKSKLNIKEAIWITLFLACLSIGATKILINITYLISPNFSNEFINEIPLTINSMVDYWICFVILVILSPIIDEIIFREVLFKTISKKFNIYAGLIVSSIIFSAFNFSSEIIGILALGVINCILYVKYENILIPMFIYFVNSLFYMIIFVPLNGCKTQRIIALTASDIIRNGILGIMLFIVGIIFLIKFVIINRIYLKESFNRNRNIES